MSLRFFFSFFPLTICFIIIFSFITYYNINSVYKTSLNSAPLIEARIFAARLEEQLDKLRNNLLTLSHRPSITAEDLKKDILQIFKQDAVFIVEIGYKKNSGESFMLLRDGDSFREATLEEVSQGPYSAFQQITTISLINNEVSLLPAVQAYYPDSPHRNKVENFSLMRMALATTEGVLMLGIDLQALKQLLTPYDIPVDNENNGFKFAYFFDFNGWLLFEMPEDQNIPLKPASQIDIARRGFTGDLGRAGLGSAFRPWAVHEDFWFMVKSVQNNTSGSLEATARYYSPEHAKASAKLYYTPVRFNTSGANPAVIGGIAFMSTSSIPQQAFSKFIWLSVGFILTFCLYAVYAFYKVQKNFGSPLYTLAKDIKNMLSFKDFSAIEQRPEFKEHQMLITASNGLIAQSMSMQTALSRVEGEVYHALSKQPVDLALAIPLPTQAIAAEYGIVGSSPAMAEVRQQIQKAAKAGTDILIWGETGTGKELVAEAVHNSSTRHSGPLISINCGALDENLLLDVLFGHMKGAFTDAKTDRKGAFLAANGGTLHLDEIGTASLKVQQSLLRALAVRRIRPLGTDVEYPFDTRVIAATNQDLRESVKNGTFREDLYYRLAVITIKTPALRHRKEDIPELAAFCIQESAANLGKGNMRLSRGTLDALMDYNWPGNVREFKNCMLRAIAFAESDILLPKHIIHTEKEITKQESYDSLTEVPQGSPSADAVSFASGIPQKPNNKKNAEPMPEGLNDRQAKAWPFIAKNKKITRAEYQEIVGNSISSRTAQHDLREFVKLGILVIVGAGPSTYYSLRKG